MSTVINKDKVKQLTELEGKMKSTFEEFILENTLATKKSVISSAKKARSLTGQLGKMCKEYRRTSLVAFDKDPATKKKLAKRRAERKAAEANGEVEKTAKSKKKSKKK